MALKLIRKQLELVHNELRLEDGFSAGPVEDDQLKRIHDLTYVWFGLGFYSTATNEFRAGSDRVVLHWQASIQGPAESPYAGGQFWLRIQFSADYPLKPPKHRILLNVGVTPQENFLDVALLQIKGRSSLPEQTSLLLCEFTILYQVWFATKIFHPNVDDKGKICVDFLLSEWKPSFTVTYILQALCSLMLHPNADNPAVPQIADMYQKDRDKFDATARQWTEKYAGLHQS